MKMPDFSKVVQKFADVKGFVWDRMCEDSGNILLYSNVAGYLSGMLAQIWTITHNDKLSKKDKSYMLPQEIVEGATNVTISLVLGKFFKNCGDWMLETGRKPIEEYREVFGFCIETKNQNFKNIIKLSLNFINDHKGEFTINNKNQKKPLTFVLENLLLYAQSIGNNEAKIKITNTIDDFAKIKAGMGFLTTLGASLIVFCALAPILRNKIAGAFSHRAQKEEGETTAEMLQYSAPMLMKKYNFTGLHPMAHKDLTII